MKKYSFFLTTDGEPDDFLAFFILTLFGTIHTIVVGESERPGDIATAVFAPSIKSVSSTLPYALSASPAKSTSPIEVKSIPKTTSKMHTHNTHPNNTSMPSGSSSPMPRNRALSPSLSDSSPSTRLTRTLGY